MIIIHRSKGSGKTTDLIKLANKMFMDDEPAYIVCKNKEDAMRIFYYAKNELGLDINAPLTYEEALQINKRNRAPKRPLKLLIDNADVFIKYVLNRDVVTAITINKE